MMSTPTPTLLTASFPRRLLSLAIHPRSVRSGVWWKSPVRLLSILDLAVTALARRLPGRTAVDPAEAPVPPASGGVAAPGEGKAEVAPTAGRVSGLEITVWESF